jgi:DNA polymerase III alpha subunit (gram-positive type)
MYIDRLVFYDTETGGTDPSFSLLTLYIRVIDQEYNLIDDLYLRIKPDNGIYKTTPQALSKNGINLEEHDKIAITESAAKVLLLNFLSRNTNDGKYRLHPSGYNIPFDDRFINAHLLDSQTWFNHISYSHVDMFPLVNALYVAGLLPGNVGNRLTDVAAYFGVNTDGAHDAKNDILLTVEVFSRIIGLIQRAQEDFRPEMELFIKNLTTSIDAISGVIGSLRKTEIAIPATETPDLAEIRNKLDQLLALGQRILEQKKLA